MFNTEFHDVGLMPYAEAWRYQEELYNKLLAAKDIDHPFYILFCEHPHVYTLGKNGQSNNLLINSDFLSKINAEYVETNRGGDITYHGPGQIVGYPIIDLFKCGFGIKSYIHKLEQAIIDTLTHYKISSERLEGAIGVWIDTKTPKARKICAIGVHVSHWITIHGFAFNISTDLNYFNHINPCGFTDKGVTSLEKELGFCPDMQEVKSILKYNLSQQLKLNLS